jgi:hypothetical protein
MVEVLVGMTDTRSMVTRVLMVGAFLVTGCGEGIQSGEIVARGEFEQRFQLFAQEAQARGRWRPEWAGIAIEFGVPSDNLTASCVRPGLGARRIIVNETNYRRLPEELQTMLIFHELGHCALSREHEPAGALSIMSQPLPDRLSFQHQYDELMDELFSR